MNKIIRKISILILILIISITSTSAYVIPKDYRTTETMNDIQVYDVSINHIEEPWAFDNLRQLAQGYTNGGYPNPQGLIQLKTKMDYYKSLLLKQKL